jgi:preprotein translocase subunit SecA
VLGTERHESRRIDNQLRGRSGRQGDPGRSKFYLSLQDDLMRIFGSDRMDGMLQKLGLKEGEAIIHPWINKAIERAQAKVEARNFDIRKNILKYDNVMNDQRKVVFEQRKEFMAQETVRDTIDDMRHGVIDDMVARSIPEQAYAEQWDVAGLKESVATSSTSTCRWRNGRRKRASPTRRSASACARPPTKPMPARGAELVEVMTYVEKQVLLQTLDHLWREHLVTLDHLRQVIGWRGYAQRDPLNEYKSEAFDLFNGPRGPPARAGHGPAHAYRGGVPAARARELPPMFASTSIPATGENEMAMPQGQASEPVRHSATRRTPPRPCPPRPAIPRIRPAGARSAATRHARAGRARNTSTATGGSWPDPAQGGGTSKRGGATAPFACLALPGACSARTREGGSPPRLTSAS